MSFTIHPDIAQAHTLPTDFYTEERYFQASKTHIFEKTWQFVDNSDALRMGEAALAVAASASVEIILDSFCDSDRAVTLCELDWLIGDTIRGLPASS